MRRAIFITASLAMAVVGCSMTRPENGTAANAYPPAASGPAAQMTAPERQAMVAKHARAEATVRARELRKAQQALQAEGFYNGPIDGKSGPRTVAAIEAFQKRYGLRQTGWLDQPTWSALDLYGLERTHANGSQASAR